MATTGYADTFGRTVSNGLGTATSGQAYTLNGAASQFSVAPNVATIAPSSAGEKFGYLDLQTQDVTITGQVALTAIPSSNLATVGFVARMSSTSNYFVGSMMVAAGGAISLRFSKVISGSLVTLATVSTGLTYVANTFYNLTFACRWSQLLQTNVFQSKLWVVGGTPPGGWMATTTDPNFTNYTAGTQVGIHTRDESTIVGSVAAKFQNVATSTYSLPVPASTDPMCYDPAFVYPRQTALESLADAADAAMATLDPTAALAGLFPRVRVSCSSVAVNTATVLTPSFNATEYNIGTPTNLGYDSGAIYLPVGIWMATYELRMAEAASDWLWVSFGNSPGLTVNVRSNPTKLNSDGTGGTGHISELVVSSDPAAPIRVGVGFLFNNSATTYTFTYQALSAIKVSDYFT